ncbi:hypothetical protein [Enterobacter cloacae]|uniref:hypothetical protein n=1 Tax=Enterobacter cloacae TaxID=550 RepID=UPI002A486013|nr:hypothetical protein [Enterobacter cloacae]
MKKNLACLILFFFIANKVNAEDTIGLIDFQDTLSATPIYFSSSINISACNVFVGGPQKKNNGRYHETNIYYYSCSNDVANHSQLNFSWIRKNDVFRWISDDVKSDPLTISEEDSCCLAKVKSLKFFSNELSAEFSDSELKNSVGDLIVLYK